MTTPYAEAPATRPTLLTIICILSFLFGIWGLWGGVQSAFTDKPQRDLEKSKAEFEKALAAVEGQGPAEEMMSNMYESTVELGEKSIEHKVPLGYMGMALSLLSIAGVWLMWNLKKNGFWLYLVATISGLLGPLYYLGTGSAAITGVAVLGIVSLIFIILYGVSLKHMR